MAFLYQEYRHWCDITVDHGAGQPNGGMQLLHSTCSDGYPEAIKQRRAGWRALRGRVLGGANDSALSALTNR
jgi:hypothetical protein